MIVWRDDASQFHSAGQIDAECDGAVETAGQRGESGSVATDAAGVVEGRLFFRRLAHGVKSEKVDGEQQALRVKVGLGWKVDPQEACIKLVVEVVDCRERR